jgi:hypothetical protein
MKKNTFGVFRKLFLSALMAQSFGAVKVQAVEVYEPQEFLGQEELESLVEKASKNSDFSQIKNLINHSLNKGFDTDQLLVRAFIYTRHNASYGELVNWFLDERISAPIAFSQLIDDLLHDDDIREENIKKININKLAIYARNKGFITEDIIKRSKFNKYCRNKYNDTQKKIFFSIAKAADSELMDRVFAEIIETGNFFVGFNQNLRSSPELMDLFYFLPRKKDIEEVFDHGDVVLWIGSHLNEIINNKNPYNGAGETHSKDFEFSLICSEYKPTFDEYLKDFEKDFETNIVPENIIRAVSHHLQKLTTDEKLSEKQKVSKKIFTVAAFKDQIMNFVKRSMRDVDQMQRDLANQNVIITTLEGPVFNALAPLFDNSVNTRMSYSPMGMAKKLQRLSADCYIASTNGQCPYSFAMRDSELKHPMSKRMNASKVEGKNRNCLNRPDFPSRLMNNVLPFFGNEKSLLDIVMRIVHPEDIPILEEAKNLWTQTEQFTKESRPKITYKKEYTPLQANWSLQDVHANWSEPAEKLRFTKTLEHIYSKDIKPSEECMRDLLKGRNPSESFYCAMLLCDFATNPNATSIPLQSLSHFLESSKGTFPLAEKNIDKIVFKIFEYKLKENEYKTVNNIIFKMFNNIVHNDKKPDELKVAPSKTVAEILMGSTLEEKLALRTHLGLPSKPHNRILPNIYSWATTAESTAARLRVKFTDDVEDGGGLMPVNAEEMSKILWPQNHSNIGKTESVVQEEQMDTTTKLKSLENQKTSESIDGKKRDIKWQTKEQPMIVGEGLLGANTNAKQNQEESKEDWEALKKNIGTNQIGRKISRNLSDVSSDMGDFD